MQQKKGRRIFRPGLSVENRESVDLLSVVDGAIFHTTLLSLNFLMRLTRCDDERRDQRDAQGLQHVLFWIADASSSSDCKNTETSVQADRPALCPAHNGRRSERPAVAAATDRCLTSPRWSGYGRISVAVWLNCCIKALSMPRASLPVKPLVRPVCPASLRRSASR